MSLLIRLKHESERDRVIAEVGDVQVLEMVLTMERASAKNTNLKSISHQSLLPSRTRSKYVTTSEAHKKTDLSEETIRRLARDGKIDAMKIEGRWLVLLESLLEHIQKVEKRGFTSRSE